MKKHPIKLTCIGVSEAAAVFRAAKTEVAAEVKPIAHVSFDLCTAQTRQFGWC